MFLQENTQKQNLVFMESNILLQLHNTNARMLVKLFSIFLKEWSVVAILMRSVSKVLVENLIQTILSQRLVEITPK